MATSPKDNEQKMQRMLNAWETLAPGKSFGGMTLAQFQAAAAPAQAARQRIDDLEYIVKLIGKVTTVSVETVKIVRSLPELQLS